MPYDIRKAIRFLFQWGEHAKFVTDIAEYFGLWKMVISSMGGLLAAFASSPDTNITFWIAMSGLAGFAVTLVAINAVWGLFNKRQQTSKHKMLAPTTSPDVTIRRLIADQPIGIPGRTVTADELIGWETLYEEYDAANGKELRLRFLPDSSDQASDALLLICYGYKIIRKIDAIPMRFANNLIADMLQNTIGTRQPYIAGVMAAINNISQARDFGQKCKDEGTIERVALLEGGKYRLTIWGENKARALACDQIARA